MFYLKKSKASDGKAPIYARITVDKKREEISVKQSVEERIGTIFKAWRKEIARKFVLSDVPIVPLFTGRFIKNI